MQKIKRAVIKEELVALTGDFKKAVILNQFIYWSERVSDFDKFVEEEKKRASFAMTSEERGQAEIVEQLPLSQGWIYKSAEEMSEETMLGLSRSNIGTHLNYLVEQGWLDRRKNPKWKADKTFQYRVNIINIQRDLLILGYSLEGYKIDISLFQNETSMSNNRTSVFRNETASSKTEQQVLKQNSNTRDYFKEYFREDLEEEDLIKGLRCTIVEIVGENSAVIDRLITKLLENGYAVSVCKEDILYAYRTLIQDSAKKKVADPVTYFANGIAKAVDSRQLTGVYEPIKRQETDFKPIQTYNWLEG